MLIKKKKHANILESIYPLVTYKFSLDLKTASNEDKFQTFCAEYFFICELLKFTYIFKFFY